MTGNEKVILDAGHGGDEPGAIYNGRKEKDDTLRLTLAVGRILEENGVSTLYTRTTDVYDRIHCSSETKFPHSRAGTL